MSLPAGTSELLRQALRRDRVLAPVWLAMLAVLCLTSAAATPDLYADAGQRERAAAALNDSPAIVALYGPVLDVRSVGELAMTKMTVLYALLLAVLVVVMVRRHTRLEEESGHTELVAATSVGREAPLAAAVLEAVLVSLAAGALAALADIAGGLDPMGSLVFGGVWAGTGLVATGVAAVCCQLSASARTCAAAAAGVLGALYAVRAIGDAASQTWLSWLSPFGWNTQVRAWSEPRWWALGLYPVLAALLLKLALALRRRRDLGAGLLAPRPGPAAGSPRLRSPLALALRVHASALVLWSAAVGLLGLLFGFIAPGLDDLVATAGAQEMVDRLGGAMLAAVLAVMAVVVTCFGISVTAHAGADEVAGRAAQVLTAGGSRPSWFGSTAVLALAGPAWLLAVTGAALWAGDAVAGGDTPGNPVVAALGWAPAVWVVVALALLLLAWQDRRAVIGWAWPALFLVLTLVGELLELPGWLTGLSPYSHVPAMPAVGWEWTPELALTAVAAAVTAAAWLRFRSRDMG